MIVGYARVSTDGQTLDCQQAQLRSVGAEVGAEKVYSEKISGAITDRPALAKALAALGNGDVLVVSIGWRVARAIYSTHSMQSARLARASNLSAIRGPITPHGRLMLTVLGGLAEFERHLILARTSEGRKRAQARGVKFGRKSKLTAHQQREALERR